MTLKWERQAKKYAPIAQPPIYRVDEETEKKINALGWDGIGTQMIPVHDSHGWITGYKFVERSVSHRLIKQYFP